MTRRQAVAVGVVGVTYTVVIVVAFWLHPKATATVLGICLAALAVIIREDGRSIGRGFDEITTPHCDLCGALTHHNERRCRDCRQEAQ